MGGCALPVFSFRYFRYLKALFYGGSSVESLHASWIIPLNKGECAEMVPRHACSISLGGVSIRMEIPSRIVSEGRALLDMSEQSYHGGHILLNTLPRSSSPW